MGLLLDGSITGRRGSMMTRWRAHEIAGPRNVSFPLPLGLKASAISARISTNKSRRPLPAHLLCLFFTRHGRPYSCTALWATLWFLCSMSLRNTTTRRREKASALSNAPLMSFNCWRESREREEDFWKRKKTFGVIDSLSVGDLSNNIPTASPLISNRSLPPSSY